MSETSSRLFPLLPAVFRTRDATSGQLEAFFGILDEQLEIVRGNIAQLQDDQFIETCAPWAIPYIGQLLGFDPVHTASLAGPDSRAEVANTIGYRRRKGTLVALEQVTQDVSGRSTMAVEEFQRLVANLSLRNVQPGRKATADLRNGADLEDQAGPFTRLNRTIDVRRIAPRNLAAVAPDPTPLEIALHGPGRFNIPDVSVWMWRWKSWKVTRAPAFRLGGGAYFFSSLGAPARLFQAPAPETAPFQRLTTESDVPEPILRRRFTDRPADFYPASLQLWIDGQPVGPDRIACANLGRLQDGGSCRVPPGKIAIDPELGRIQFAPDLAHPARLEVTYHYGAPAPMGGGPYDRTGNVSTDPVTFDARVGSALHPTLESAVSAWNLLPPGSTGRILLPGFGSHPADLTLSQAIRIPHQSRLLVAAAELPDPAGVPHWTESCATLFGNIEVVAPPTVIGPDGNALPMGQLEVSGIRLCGQLRLEGEEMCVHISDSTLVPGIALDVQGEPTRPAEPSVVGSAIGASLSLSRVVTGPVALPSSCSVRICSSIVDATTPWCPAFCGPSPSRPGPSLHIEDSTVVGRVWAQSIPLASNTIFRSRLGKCDPWKAAVWAQRRQTGCVRFCWLPWDSLVPRRYECLPAGPGEARIEPQFVSLRFTDPAYGLLSGDVALSIWKGADNGSQMGAFLQIQETEAVGNIQIRSAEFLPANLERGVFLVPSRPELRPLPRPRTYGYQPTTRCCLHEPGDTLPAGIGVGLI